MSYAGKFFYHVPKTNSIALLAKRDKELAVIYFSHDQKAFSSV